MTIKLNAATRLAATNFKSLQDKAKDMGLKFSIKEDMANIEFGTKHSEKYGTVSLCLVSADGVHMVPLAEDKDDVVWDQTNESSGPTLVKNIRKMGRDLGVDVAGMLSFVS